MLKINYSNKEDVVISDLGPFPSLDPLANNDDVVADPTLAPSLEPAGNTEAKSGKFFCELGELLDENSAASRADAGQEDGGGGTGDHGGVIAPVGVATNMEKNIKCFAEACTEANLDEVVDSSGYNPYADASFNPYADARVNPFAFAALNPYNIVGLNPYAGAGINPYAIGGFNPYAIGGLNSYTIGGINPYAFAGPNSYSGAGLNPYSGGGPNPYSGAGPNPYSDAGLNPYSGAGHDPYALGGLNPYVNAGYNPYTAPDPNINAETNPDPYAETVHEPLAESTPPDHEPDNKNPNADGGESSIELLYKHLLQNTWTLWYLENDRSKSWQNMQTEITSFDTVEDFWSLYNFIKPPSDLKLGSDYSVFKRNIRPMWEDEANQHGGRWVITLNKNCKLDLDNLWLEVLLCLIGEAFDYSDEVCGAVVNIRGKNNKISIWTSNGNMEHAVMEIGRKLCDALCLGHNNYLQYQLHTDTMMKQGYNVHSIYTL